MATKEGVFAYMQRLLQSEPQYADIPAFIKNNFVLLRCHAENLTRHYYINGDVKDVTTEQIYAALAMTGELEGQHIQELIAMERWALSELHMLNSKKAITPENANCLPWAWAKDDLDDFSVQLLAGASLHAIRENGLCGPAEIGAGLGGPTLMPYVEWLLHRSEILGFKRLYFIARDGYILKRMADVLIKALELDIQTYYIYGSRRAWRTPAYMGEEGEIKELLKCSYLQYIQTVEDLSDVLRIPAEKLRPYLPNEYAAEGRIWNFTELAFCVYCLEHNQWFRDFYKECLSEDRKIVQDYIRQEVDTSDEHFAFVELAGGGDTQICLSRMMNDFYKGRIHTFFYKMDKVRMPDNKCVFYDFFPSRLKNHLLIEMICRAPEGQAEGYKFEEGKIVPIIKNDEAELYKKQGYEDYIWGIEVFSKVYAEGKAFFRPEPSLKASFACMDYMRRQESGEAYNFFAGLPNSATGREKHIQSFASPLTKREVQNYFIREVGIEALSHYQGTDFGMSVSNSPLYIQRKVEKYVKNGKEIRLRWLQMFPEAGGKQTTIMEGLGRWLFKRLGQRVVLYGAGKWGVRWHDELCADKSIKVVQWLDRDYKRLKDDLPVDGDMDSLGKEPFDWIMLGVGKKDLLQEIKTNLLKRGVPEEKIYDSLSFLEWLTNIKSYIFR